MSKVAGISGRPKGHELTIAILGLIGILATKLDPFRSSILGPWSPL
jgi:hypothetical protein